MMLVISTISGSPGRRLAQRAVHATAFTLMELMVAITILIFIILSVGVIFKGASNSVSVSQATMELLSNVRAVQQIMERDISGMDRNGFLVIRSRLQTLPTAAAPNPRHFDQFSFISLGSFPNRTGANDPLSPFAESTVANASHVWYGQLVLERNLPPDSSYNAKPNIAPNQAAKLPLYQLPTGVYDDGTGNLIVKENECTLGRHGFLLLPGPADPSITNISPNGRPLRAYPSIDYNYVSPASFTVAGESIAADITSSRIAVAAVSPSQLLREIAADRATGDLVPELNRFCYRFKALASVYDTDVPENPFVNGYFRMHPVALQGVSSFTVEWTDGQVYTVPGPLQNQLKWYGYGNMSNNGLGDNNVEAAFATGNANGDNYVAVFNYLNRSKWPKALRITYHVAELNNRLQGGRDFTQVIKLPE